MKVSNGTLGTILEISRQKMTVSLDGTEQRTVSFSPNLYPYLDNGWATTIHKAQGVTVDHVKMLASFEQYRNLSYVGMTRHRYTLQVFGSDLDFWREEKVIDRLSRVQEKLSGFDYMDADKITEVLAEDTTILWHDRKIGQVKDLWSAVKVTAHGLFSQVTGLSRQPDKGTGEQGYPSFDHTEEKRSTKFFKDGSSQEPSSGLGGGDTASGMGDTPFQDGNTGGAHSKDGALQGTPFDHSVGDTPSGDGSPQSPSSSSGMGDTPFQDGNTSGAHSKDGASQGTPFDHSVGNTPSKDGSPQKPSSDHGVSDTLSSDRNRNPYNHEDISGDGAPQNPSSHSVGNTFSRDENIRSAYKQGGTPAGDVEGTNAGIQGNAPPAVQPGMPQSQGFQKEGPGGLEAEGKTRKAGNQAPQRPSATVTIKEKFPSFKEVEEQLKDRMGELAEELLGKPTSRGKDKLKFGKRGSVCVFISGDRQGVYTNFESGVKGGPLKLIEEQQGLSSSLEALKWGSHWLGTTYTVVEHRTVEKPEEGKPSAWKPVMPVPKSAGNPDIKGNKYLNYMLKDGAREGSRHAYRDEYGNLKGYVFRIEKADGGKITPPLSYCENDKGLKAWKWQAFEKDNKTPYGIEKLALDQTKPVLVVEGEKTADAAQKLFPECHVLTWGGGAGNVGKTNWDPLTGRDVVIWPDNDSGGHKAAGILQEIITLANAEKGKGKPVSIVALPQGVPHKWDLADPLPAGWSLDTVKGMVREALPKDIEWADNQRVSEVASASGKTSTSIKTDIGKKGEGDIYSKAFEKTGAGFHQGLSPAPLPEELRDHAFHERSGGLARQKTEDGRENGGAGSQATQETPARQYNPGEAETLAFLTREIDVRKHKWLSERFCQDLLQVAAKDPLQALNWWQDISEDYSFKPSAPLSAGWTFDTVKGMVRETLSKDIEWVDNQKVAEVASASGKTSDGIENDIGEKGGGDIYPKAFEKTGAGFHQGLSPAPLPGELRDHVLHERSDGLARQKTEDGRENGEAGSQATQETPARQYNPGEAETLAFLTREIDVRKHKWLSERFCQDLLQVAAKDPLQALNWWQDISEDYSFKPSAPLSAGWTFDTVKGMVRETLSKDIEWTDNQRVSKVASISGKTSDGIENDIEETARKFDNVRDAPTSRQVEAVADQHMLNEDLREKVFSSGEKLKTGTEEQKQNIEGFDNKVARDNDTHGSGIDQTTKNYSPQEQEILAYLSQEVNPEKHTWIKEKFANKVFDLAKGDPFAALGKWQRVSRDFSFEPSIPDSQMTREQKGVKDSIVKYLHDHVQPDPKRWIRPGECQDILELADKKPENALHAWQNLTRNYDFNPFLDKLNDREVVVYGYLKEKLSDKDARITKTMLADVTIHLLKDPLKAYGQWSQYSHDHTFDPKTGIPTIEIQARDYISALKDQVTPKTLKSWEQNLTRSPETILQEAQEFMKVQQEHEKFTEKLNTAVSRFISLSEDYEKLSPIDRKRHETGETLSRMAEEHAKDEKFMQGIKDSRNDTAIKRLNEEMRIQQQLKDKELYYDMDMGM